MNESQSLSVLLLNLFSEKYPAIGESHGLSVVAGAVQNSLGDRIAKLFVVDMVAHGEQGFDRALRIIRDEEINVVGVGVAYGTYSTVVREFGAVREALTGRDALVAFGGPLATYLGGRLLREAAPEAFVIQGEAEEALPRLIMAWSDATGTRSAPGWRTAVGHAEIPNVLYLDAETGEEVRAPRRLVHLDGHGAPYRGHIPAIQRMGGQIFVETSRGCSWAACTFCLRGLTDVSGRSSEYRRRNPESIVRDIATLRAADVTQVTFADEDFLGESLDDAEEFVLGLEGLRGGPMDFGASCTVHSVYHRRDDEKTARRRRHLLERLVETGLSRVFLGVESCSATQLKRFAKGHTRDEAAEAMHRLQELGIRVDVGVILLDPLCTLDEVEDSLRFMLAQGMVDAASGLSNQMRLQESSPYLRIVRRHEHVHGRPLITGAMDPDTLSFPYRFADDGVHVLADEVSRWAARTHPLYYPAKSLSRFGDFGVLGRSAAGTALNGEIEKFRTRYASATLAAIQRIRDLVNPAPVFDEIVAPALLDLARALHTALLWLGDSGRDHPVIRRALADAEYFISESAPQNTPHHHQNHPTRS